MNVSAITSTAPAAAVDPISGAAGTAASALEAPTSTPSTPPPVAPETPQALAVSVATAAAAIKQSSLAPLLADLAQAVSLPGVPAPVQAAISQVLAAQTPLDPPPSAAVLQQATAASGLFLEAQLGAGATPPAGDLKSALLVVQQVLKSWLDSAPPAEAEPPPAATTPTTANPAPSPSYGGVEVVAQPAASTSTVLQAASNPIPALLALAESGQPAATEPLPPQTPVVLAAVPISVDEPTNSAPALSSALNAAPASAPPSSSLPVAATAPAPSPVTAPQIAASQALAAVAVQPFGLIELDDSPAVQRSAYADLLLEADPESGPPPTNPAPPGATASAPPPPYRDGPTLAQRPVLSSLAAGVDPGVAGRRLLTETSGALARQELHQIASLPSSAPAQKPGDTDSRWMFELPFATPQGAAVAQFEISRDGGHGGAADSQPTWRARFSIDLEPMGPVHAQVALTGARAGVTLWAERPATAARLQAQQASLAEGLEQAEFNPAVSIHVGTPPRAAAAPRAGRFLDQAS